MGFTSECRKYRVLSINPELTKTATKKEALQGTLIDNLNKQVQERKIVSNLFLSLGSAGRKIMTGVFPYMAVAETTLPEQKTVNKRF